MPIQIDLGRPSHSKIERKSSGPVIGIDLGTTNSLVAYCGPGQQPQILSRDGKALLLKSRVQYGPAGQVLAVGTAARGAGTVFSAKRFMGRSASDVRGHELFFPFEVREDGPSTQLRIKPRPDSDFQVTPIEVAATLLRELKATAEAQLGQNIERAVITVPAYFDDAQRVATKMAGRLAGLDVLRVLNEPTAAALAYGWGEKHEGLVAVYDLGGGTFDLTLLRIENNVYEVLATAGDTALGGDDIDRSLAQKIIEKLLQKQPELQTLPVLERSPIIQEALVLAEQAKVALSVGSSLDVELRGQVFSVSRRELEEAALPWIEKTLALCARALQDASLETSKIQDVVLVGGSTRMPLVRQKVESFFGRAPNTNLNPDEAVALGAALQAQILEGHSKDQLLLDVIPLSLGIETMGGTVSKLLHRNTTIPNEARENFTNHADGQTAFDLHVVQGERELSKDCRSLARFRLRGLSPAPAGFHRIEVLYRVDANGILNVRAKDLRSGKTQEIEVRPSFGLSDQDVEKLLEDAFDKADSDMILRQWADLKVEADTVSSATEKAMANAGHLIAATDLAQVKARWIDLKNILGSAPASPQGLDQLRQALDRLNEVSQELAEVQVNAALGKALSGQEVSKV